MTKPMKPPTGTPCDRCPFRKTSWPGYLGADTPDGFLETTMRDEPMPCHKTIDYECDDWADQLTNGKARHCSGALIFFANIIKSSRDPKRPRLPKDKETVFATPMEFLAYHKKTK